MRGMIPALTGLTLAALLGAAPAAAEYYFYGFTGLSFTDDGDLDIEQEALGTDLELGGISYEGAPFDPPPYWGLRAGYYFEDPALQPFGIELDFLHYKILAETDKYVSASGSYMGAPAGGSVPLDTYVNGFEISNGVNFHSVNLTARHGWLKDETAPEGRVQLYGGAGLAAVRLVADMFLVGQTDAVRTESKWTGPGVNAFVGGRYLPLDLFGGNAGFFAEYRFTHVGATDLPAPNGGEARISAINTHHVLFGIGVHF